MASPPRRMAAATASDRHPKIPCWMASREETETVARGAELSPKAAAARYKLRDEDLRREIREGRISCRRVGKRSLLDPSKLEEELAARICRADGCQKITLSSSGVCRDHVATVLLSGRTPAPEATSKMAAAKRGRRLSEAHRAAIAAALRHPTEVRECAHGACSEMFEVRTSSRQRCCCHSCAAFQRWVEKREQLLGPIRAANERRRQPRKERQCQWCRASLGLVPVHRIHSGRGRFCSHSHSMRWLWARRPEALRRPRFGRVVTCACGRETRYLRPSRLPREQCRHCRGRSPEVRAHLALLREEHRAELERVKQAEGLVDRHEARARLRRSRSHITRWAASAVLPPVRREIGGVTHLLFKDEDIQRVVATLLSTQAPSTGPATGRQTVGGRSGRPQGHGEPDDPTPPGGLGIGPGDATRHRPGRGSRR